MEKRNEKNKKYSANSSYSYTGYAREQAEL